MNLRDRLKIQTATQQWVVTFMQQYQVPAAAMEDALNKTLSLIKDQVIADLLVEQAQSKQEQEQKQEEKSEPSQEEDDDD